MIETTTARNTRGYELPRNWLAVGLGEVCSIFSGYGFPKSYQGKSEGQIPFFKVGDISRAVTSGQHRLVQAQHYVSQDESIELKATPLPMGTIVFAKIGEAIKLNRRALLAQDSLVDNNVMGLHAPSSTLNQQYLYYWMLTVKFDEISRATAVPSIRKSDVEQLPIPLPPLNEQRRIVEKLEELFTKLDAGVRSLKQVQAQLKSFRRSVLKAAVEGELSREWREAHKDDIESASELLERILQERREKFTGKKYKEPSPPDTSELPMLPNGWEWARLDSLASIKGGITKDSKRRYENARTVPYLRVANVQRGYLDLSELKDIEASEDVIEHLLLKPGDVLFTEGGDRDKLGRGWIWNGEVAECIHQNHVFRARLYSAGIEPKFVSWFGNTFGQVWFMRQGKQTTNLASINLAKLSTFPVPLPPLEEQRFIVEEVERRLSVVDKLEATVEANLKQAGGLRQSILKQAFSGELLPQDPDDEPASVLLEQIREKRHTTKQKVSRGRRGKTGPTKRGHAEQGGLF